MHRLITAMAAGALAAQSAHAAPASPAPYLEVHVNRVALEAEGPKTAIVESNRVLKDGSFTVLHDGEAQLRGTLKPLPAFPDWGEGKSYYLADFSALTHSGRYMIRARSGDLRAESSSIVVGPDALFRTIAPALLHYFRESRWLDAGDRAIKVFGSDRVVDASGGWKDAGGDNGKYLSHLSYANFFSPQQAGLVAWVLGRAYDASPRRFRAAGLETEIVDEAFWGADFMHRLLSPEGYFYMTVFEGWGRPDAERQITGYVGAAGKYTTDYHAGFREGGGMAVAALARAARLAVAAKRHGAFTGAAYLADAERGWAHLAANNAKYIDNGKENIIDDYCALIAASELFRTTGKPVYRAAADARAASLAARLTGDGWWRSDDGERPFYHAADAGMPVLALTEYLATKPAAAAAENVRATIRRALDAQAKLDGGVVNPFGYPRQQFRAVNDGVTAPIAAGFFMPHANETGYWWQGESARLSSLAAATVLGGREIGETGATFGVSPNLARSAAHALDWTLGRNPYDVSMLYGFGGRNPDYSDAGGTMVTGGISNGITGAADDEAGGGIAFAVGPPNENWRWSEQWLPHSAWMLLAVAVLNPDPPTKQTTK